MLRSLVLQQLSIERIQRDALILMDVFGIGCDFPAVVIRYDEMPYIKRLTMGRQWLNNKRL